MRISWNEKTKGGVRDKMVVRLGGSKEDRKLAAWDSMKELSDSQAFFLDRTDTLESAAG